MRALVYTAPGVLALESHPDPLPGPGEVLLRVRLAGVCGSDVAGYLGHSRRRRPPLVLGHECVGTIAALGEGVEGWQVGERVVVNPLFPCWRCSACLAGQQHLCAHWSLLGMDQVQGAFAEYVRAPARSLFKVPDALPDERAVLTEPLACGLHMLRLAQAPPFSPLAIWGAGTQGCLILAMAKRLGYGPIFSVDLSPERLAIAAELGADQTLNPSETDPVAAIKAATDGLGVPLVVEAVGNAIARQQVVEVAAPGGTVMMMGMHEEESSIPWTTAIRKELRLQTSFCYNFTDFRRSLEWLARHREVPLERWVRALPLEEGHQAFQRLTTQPGAVIKFALRP